MALLSAALLPAFSHSLSKQKKTAAANSFWGGCRSPPSVLNLHLVVSVEVQKSVWNGLPLAIPNCGIGNRLQGGSYKDFYIVLFMPICTRSHKSKKTNIYSMCSPFPGGAYPL